MTLDSIHTKKIKDLERIDREKIKVNLNKLENKKNELMKDRSSCNAIEIMKVYEEIENVKKIINDTKDNLKQKSYYVEAGDVLFSYYDTFENIKPNSVEHSKKDSILSFFEHESNSQENKEDDKIEEDGTREFLQNKYLELGCTENIVSKKKVNTWQNAVIVEYCDVCNSELILVPSEGIAECSSCGNIQEIVEDGSKTSFKDTPKETAYYSYKRTNHFNEWLAQFQGKETITIPRDILLKIWAEIKKERIRNIDELTKSKMRAILKKLKISKYYEHVPYIISLLNGQKAPYMTRKTEELLRLMFQKIQTPFVEFCPKERKNFLSYSYVLHKFVEILGMNHLKQLFPLLKSREKLFAADLIWKQICGKLNWRFYKSI